MIATARGDWLVEEFIRITCVHCVQPYLTLPASPPQAWYPANRTEEHPQIAESSSKMLRVGDERAQAMYSSLKDRKGSADAQHILCPLICAHVLGVRPIASVY